MKCSISYSSKDIARIAQEEGADFEKMLNVILKELCYCKPLIRMVRTYVRNNGGNTEDAEDLFQESLSQLISSQVNKKI